MKLRNNKNKKLIKLSMKFQPWDYGFNLEIEKEMFNKMYKFFSSDKPIAVGSKKTAKDIKLIIKLLDIILEKDEAVLWGGVDNPHKWTLIKYVNIRNANRFGVFNKLEEPLVKNLLRQEKAWYLYNKLRLYRMKTMWD